MLRVPCRPLTAETTELPEDAARYAVKVHRLPVGSSLILFDPVAAIYAEARLLSDRLPKVVVDIGELKPAATSNLRVHLLQGVGKADKPEQAVRDATAFGASKLTLVQTSRSVAKSSGSGRGERLQRVAEQVARQCERGDLPEMDGPKPFSEILETCEAERKWICAFHPSSVPLAVAARSVDWGSDELAVLVGPEGGFGDDEVEAAIEAGFSVISLGPYVLRSETACGAVLAGLRVLSETR